MSEKLGPGRPRYWLRGIGLLPPAVARLIGAHREPKVELTGVQRCLCGVHLLALGLGTCLCLGAFIAKAIDWATGAGMDLGDNGRASAGDLVEDLLVRGILLATLGGAALLAVRRTARDTRQSWLRQYGIAPPCAYLKAKLNVVLVPMCLLYTIQLPYVFGALAGRRHRALADLANHVLLGVIAVTMVLVVTAYWFRWHRVRRMRRWLDQGVPVCLECGYPLRGIASRVCPECGAFSDYPLRDGEPVLPTSAPADPR